MIKYGETYKILPREYYRNRKNKAAIKYAMNRRLIFNILCQTKTTAGICSCDLNYCYNRTVHYFVSLIM